ncbi:hypothetical protein CYMTET_39561 [Cymbomonas tetramitiformis]|uniref:Uncharacterized protein n=1 Tax=Cymbomonas tetramitiformis TaxID=36881 RepID=A0AAE0CBJ9_9CHLO|nr:hypothetical protein CYMTET_39561 [Cymbomonas tetramitiformis]
MAASTGNLALWTEPRMKVRLQQLLKLADLAARTRVATWQKQRDQIMAWVTEHVSELKEIPSAVEDLTEGLVEAELFAVDVAGTLVPGPWTVSAGAWAIRKEVEAEKFSAVAEWARAILALRVQTPATTTNMTTGGTGGSSGAMQSGVLADPTVAGGSGAGATSGGGPGGGAPAGAAGAHGSLGVGTVASAAAAPSAGAQVADPQSIAAAIAAAVNAKLDALGDRLAVLEAQRSAIGGAPTALSGSEPAEAKELRCAIRDSLATLEQWDVPRCAQACADLVHEAQKIRPQLTELRSLHPFGKTPMRTLEAHAFEPLVYVLPELRAEECELDELPPGSEATLEHWRALVHLLQARVGEFQRFVKSQRPTVPISDVMVASFFRKRKRVMFEGEEEEARAAGGGHGALPPLDAARRDRLATLGAGFRTVNEEQLARALRGELAPEDVVRPPVQRLLQEDEGRLKLQNGELTMVAKKKKCKDFAEWERGFLRILCKAPAEARDNLMDFVEWARTIAAEFSFTISTSSTSILFGNRGRLSQRMLAEAEAGARALELAEAAGAAVVAVEAVEAWLIPAVAVPLGEPMSSSEAPAGAEGVPVTTPDPMVDADAELELEQPIAVEDIGAVDADVGCGPPDGEDGVSVPLVSPVGVDAADRWWANLREDEFIPVWDVLGGPRRHTRVPMAWEMERMAPLPVTQLRPETWTSPSEPGRTRCSVTWPRLRADILLRATTDTMEACGTSEGERRCYEEECVRVGCAIPTLTGHAHLVAAAFQDWHDVDFLVRCAACGVGWPSEVIDLDEPYRVPNCVGPEHMDVMREEIRRESGDGHIFLAGWRLPLGVIALGMVEKVMEFLGVLLDTSGEVCTAAIDEERIAVVVQKAGELRAQAARGMVARRRLESLLGLLAFCSHVVWGLSLYTRRGFAFLTATAGRRMVRLPRPVLDDLSVLEQVVRRYNGRKVQLERQVVDQQHFAKDASGTLGFGGVWERLFFMLSWDDLARLPQRPWMSGTTVVVKIDNQSAMYQELQREAERYRAEALAPETRRCYGTGVRAFVTFCITFACLGCLQPLLPATDVTLCMFITDCSWCLEHQGGLGER